MPVVSPSRYNPSTSSALTSGTYRSSLNPTSAIDKPYFRSNSGTYVTSTIRTSYGDRTTEYRSRFSDVDGKRERKTSLVEYSRNSRAPSVTDSDSGTTRYRSDRSESRGRDVSTTRSETSKDKNRRNPLNSAALAMSTAELYNKYSPANYVPLTQRLQNQNYGEIARSKSISSDIGRPPADARSLRKARNSTVGGTISERPETRRSYKESSPTYKRSSLTNGLKDSNGNEVPSVAEIRKRFDPKMAVTKLPANETKYSAKSEVEKYLNQLKNCENGTSGYTKVVPKDDKPVPVHLPSEKNGIKWEIGSGSSRSNSNSDLSSRTVSETMQKPYEKNDISVSLTAKLPDRLASIKSQLDPNNPIGKILEKSTVIQVENGEKKDIQTDIQKQGIKNGKHTSNFASYIQISQPIVSGAEENRLKYIDSEDKSLEIDSPSAGFENKTFDHEDYLKKRNEKLEDKMETSTESSDSIEVKNDTEKRVLDQSEVDEIKAELAGGRGAARRSGEREATRSPAAPDDKPDTCGLNGLRNIGNTCFMNSVLQCLSNTRPLLRYLADEAMWRKDAEKATSAMSGALFKAFASVIRELWAPGAVSAVVNTTALKAQVQKFAPRFMGYSQQDAQEFLRYLLEGLHEDVNRVTVKPAPILTEIDDTLSVASKAAEAWSRYTRLEASRVADIFVGQLRSTLKCSHCGRDSVTFDPFWDLSLPVPQRNGTLKLQQCLQHFTKEEELDGDEKPTCSACGVRRKCLKWFTVQKFPQVLVLHLKRFSPLERFRGKLNVVVEFPLTQLDMSPYAADKQRAVYNLYAVSNHSGTTYSGHYTAYCKHPHSGAWHEYNDSRVTPISEKDVVSSEAYVLFYELSS